MSHTVLNQAQQMNQVLAQWTSVQRSISAMQQNTTTIQGNMATMQRNMTKMEQNIITMQRNMTKMEQNIVTMQKENEQIKKEVRQELKKINRRIDIVYVSMNSSIHYD